MGYISKADYDAMMDRIARERIRLRHEFALLQHGEQMGMRHRQDGDGVVFQQRMVGLDEMERKLRLLLRPKDMNDDFMTGNRQKARRTITPTIKSAQQPYRARTGYALPDGTWKVSRRSGA